MIPFGDADVIVGPIAACVVCREPTRFIELNFEVPAHLGKCVDSLWNDYWNAMRSVPDEPARGPDDPF